MRALEITTVGFSWGPMTVERVCHDESRLGYVLGIKTVAGREMEIRVSPKGTRIEVTHIKHTLTRNEEPPHE